MSLAEKRERDHQTAEAAAQRLAAKEAKAARELQRQADANSSADGRFGALMAASEKKREKRKAAAVGSDHRKLSAAGKALFQQAMA